MKKQRKKLPVSDLLLNEGQLGWLPRNPREWTDGDVKRTVASIKEDTDFLEDRPILVVPFEGRYVAYGGNLRLTAAREMGLSEVPCMVYTLENEDADRETIKRRAMKDNGSFGSWDYDALAKEWDDCPLVEWGVPAWDFAKKKENTSAPTGEVNMNSLAVKYEVQVTCTTLEEQLDLIRELNERGIECKAI